MNSGRLCISMKYAPLLRLISSQKHKVAAPGLSRGGDANSPGGGGAPTYDFAKISRKLHEVERIWTPRGGGGAHPSQPLDPLMTCVAQDVGAG